MGLLRTRYTPLRQNSDHGSAAFRTTDEGHEEDEGGCVHTLECVSHSVARTLLRGPAATEIYDETLDGVVYVGVEAWQALCATSAAEDKYTEAAKGVAATLAGLKASVQTVWLYVGFFVVPLAPN